MKYPQLHYYRNLASKISHWSSIVDDSEGMAMYNRPCLVSNLSQTFCFPAIKRKEGFGRHGLNSDCMKTDVNRHGLAGVDSLDRDARRAGVRHSLVLPTPQNGTQTAP